MATNITDRLLCSICLNDFQQPKVLDCNHSFCLICLEGYVNTVATNDQFPCPLCRHTCKIPDGGVKGLVSDICDAKIPDGGVKELVNDICKAEVPPCDVCKTSVVSEFRCADCDQYLCSSCRTTHDGLKLSRGHAVVGANAVLEKPTGENPRSRSNDLCPSHSDREVRCYCKDCSVSLCAECFVIGHNGHQFLDLLDEAIRRETKEKLKLLKCDLEVRLEQFVKYSDSLKKLIMDIETSADKSCAAVDKQVESICSEVKQLGDDVKVQIQKSRDEEQTKITKPQKEMEILIEDLKASVKCTVDVMEDKSSVAVLDRIGKEKEDAYLRKLDIPAVKYTWFEESVMDKIMLAKQLGLLENRHGPTFTASFNLDEVARYGDDGVYRAGYYTQGLPWCINAAKKKKRGAGAGPSLGIYIRLGEKDDTADIKSCQVTRRLTLINIKAKHETVSRESYGKEYESGKWRGWPRCINWDTLSDKQNGFIDDNNNFTIQATVKVIKIN